MQISFFVDPQERPPETLLDDWHSLVDIALAVASAGVRVTVVQANARAGRAVRGGVEFLFLPPDRQSGLLSRTASFAALLGDLGPDVIHVHGLGFGREVLGLRALAPSVPILLQDHADRPPRFWRRTRWRRGAAAASGISFCAAAQADPFRRDKLLAPHVRVFEIPESTSCFAPGDSGAARAATGLHGDPAVLWVGHLDDNKDPLTVLDGVSEAARELPGLQLWCCFGTAPLLRAVQAKIASDPLLRDRAHLLGRVPRAQIEQLMRAADLFVLGSHREGSSFSLIEALATGLTPVVTNIPSLRVLTGDGAVGVLWPCGDSHALANELRSATAALGPRTRTEVRAHFDEHLSSAALGRSFAAAYRELSPARARALGATEPLECGDGIP
jgi:glycosyltransferase involved in cell wall biosynthesis